MPERLSKDRMPRHLAVIMDGNGRWAARRGLPRVHGHQAGLRAVRRLVRACRDFEIRMLTLYAFSQENWGRPKGEVDELMRILEHHIRSEIDEVMKNKIRIRTIGRIHELPVNLRKAIEEVIERTSANNEAVLTFALSYGGRAEIVDAAKRILEDSAIGRIAPAHLNEKVFAEYLDTQGLPDPDLLIRTGGERRISNFLLWQMAYTEIYVTDALWPDFGKAQLRRALASYQKRERRFGLTSAQIGGSGRASRS
ncbi:MAG: isoprenyl transferase [Vicinamibacteria bacterium]